MPAPPYRDEDLNPQSTSRGVQPPNTTVNALLPITSGVAAYSVLAGEADDGQYRTFPVTSTASSSPLDPQQWQGRGWMLPGNQAPNDTRALAYLPAGSVNLRARMRANNSNAIGQASGRLAGSLWWVNETDETDRVLITTFLSASASIAATGAVGAWGGTTFNAAPTLASDSVAPSRSHFLYVQYGVLLESIPNAVIGSNTVTVDLGIGNLGSVNADQETALTSVGLRVIGYESQEGAIDIVDQDKVVHVVKKPYLTHVDLVPTLARQAWGSVAQTTTTTLVATREQFVEAFRHLGAALASLGAFQRKAVAARYRFTQTGFVATTDKFVEVFKDQQAITILVPTLSKQTWGSVSQQAGVDLLTTLERQLWTFRDLATSIDVIGALQRKAVAARYRFTQTGLVMALDKFVTAFKEMDATIDLTPTFSKRVWGSVIRQAVTATTATFTRLATAFRQLTASTDQTAVEQRVTIKRLQDTVTDVTTDDVVLIAKRSLPDALIDMTATEAFTTIRLRMIAAIDLPGALKRVFVGVRRFDVVTDLTAEGRVEAPISVLERSIGEGGGTTVKRITFLVFDD